MHVHWYVEKVFAFMPQRGKSDPIKKLDFFLILLFCFSLWHGKFSPLTTHKKYKEPQHKQGLSSFFMIKSCFLLSATEQNQ